LNKIRVFGLCFVLITVLCFGGLAVSAFSSKALFDETATGFCSYTKLGDTTVLNLSFTGENPLLVFAQGYNISSSSAYGSYAVVTDSISRYDLSFCNSVRISVNPRYTFQYSSSASPSSFGVFSMGCLLHLSNGDVVSTQTYTFDLTNNSPLANTVRYVLNTNLAFIYYPESLAGGVYIQSIQFLYNVSFTVSATITTYQRMALLTAPTNSYFVVSSDAEVVERLENIENNQAAMLDYLQNPPSPPVSGIDDALENKFSSIENDFSNVGDYEQDYFNRIVSANDGLLSAFSTGFQNLTGAIALVGNVFTLIVNGSPWFSMTLACVGVMCLITGLLGIGAILHPKESLSEEEKRHRLEDEQIRDLRREDSIKYYEKRGRWRDV